MNEFKLRNPITEKAHQREVLWQITVPFVIGLIVLIAACTLVVLAATNQAGDVSRWADISLIWLILPALGVALLLTVLLAALGYGVGKLMAVIPEYAFKLQAFLLRIQGKVQQGSNLVVKPYISIASWLKAFREWLRG